MKKWKDYVGQEVNAKYAVERNIDGADVPVIREGIVLVTKDDAGVICLDDDGDTVYPFDETFELIP